MAECYITQFYNSYLLSKYPIVTVALGRQEAARAEDRLQAEKISCGGLIAILFRNLQILLLACDIVDVTG